MSIQLPFSKWPNFSNQEIKRVSKILRLGKINYHDGEEGYLFEKEFAKYIGSKYAVAVSNGTVALQLALSVFNLKKNDEVLVTCR